MGLPTRTLVAMAGAVAMLAAGCGDDATDAAGTTDPARPTVVVTTTILSDVVENIVGDALNVVTIMPVGADPHDFQASAQQVAAIGDAEVLIVNGAGFEEGLLDVIEAAESDGVSVFEAISAVETIEFAEHGHEGADPHFWTDPARMAVAADAMAAFLVANVDGIDATAVNTNAEAYIAELEAADAMVAETLVAIDEDGRVLVTNHDSFGYFADRYGFEVAGTVIPSGTTTDGASAQELAELVEVIDREGVAAIFSETTVSDELAQTITSEVGGDVAIVVLHTGSVGDDGSGAETYLAMVQTNAQRIADALAG